MTEKETCSLRVHTWGYGPRTCPNRATTHTADGKGWCKIHNPDIKAQRRATKAEQARQVAQETARVKRAAAESMVAKVRASGLPADIILEELILGGAYGPWQAHVEGVGSWIVARALERAAARVGS